jgi:hypothetical protein
VVGFFTTDRALCDAVTYVLLAGLVTWVIVTAKSCPDEWFLLALLSVLVLLGSYHRYYDFQLLMLCSTAVLQLYRGYGGHRVLAVLLVPAMLLWFPFQALAGLHLPPDSGATVTFSKTALQFLALRHEPLCLLAFATVFAWAIVKKPALR